MRSAFDIIGPPMIGPSSSHTAGAVRIGLAARHLLGVRPDKAAIALHGSFAATGKGHATDRGLVAGLLGWAPDDERLKTALEAAASEGMCLNFCDEDLGSEVHPNTALLVIGTSDGQELKMTASSIGGGSIEVISVDGYATRFSGSLDTLVLWHDDRPGFLAHVTAVLASMSSNIATIRTARTHRGADALTVIELDAPPPAEVVALLEKIDHVKKLRMIPPLG